MRFTPNGVMPSGGPGVNGWSHTDYPIQLRFVIDYAAMCVKHGATDPNRAADITTQLLPLMVKLQKWGNGPMRRWLLKDIATTVRRIMGEDFRPHELWSTMSKGNLDADLVLAGLNDIPNPLT